MTNQNSGYQGQQDKDNNQVKDNPKAGQKDNQNKKNTTPGASGQSSDKKNFSGNGGNSEQE